MMIIVPANIPFYNTNENTRKSSITIKKNKMINVLITFFSINTEINQRIL